jgi:hypothetical protein
MGRVDWKPDPQKMLSGWIWHSNLHPRVKSSTWIQTHRVSGRVWVSVGFCKCVYFRVFLGSFWVFSGLGFLSEFFFKFRVHPWVKNETQTRFCAGRVWVQPMGAKMNPKPHPSGLKPTGDPKPKAELSSLFMAILKLICGRGLLNSVTSTYRFVLTKSQRRWCRGWRRKLQFLDVRWKSIPS